MWKCGYRYLSSEKLHKICQLVPTLQIREQLVNIWVFSAVSCSFLNASIHFLWTLNYAMTEYRIILLTANFSIWTILDIIKYTCTLTAPQKQLLSEVCKVMKLILAMTATNATSERTFSALVGLKAIYEAK